MKIKYSKGARAKSKNFSVDKSGLLRDGFILVIGFWTNSVAWDSYWRDYFPQPIYGKE